MPEASCPVTKSKFQSPAQLLRRYGLKAKKSLGQNFLVSLEIARKIVALSEIPEGSVVVELAAGLGTLTLALAERAGRVIAYELDERLLEVLQKENFLPEQVILRKGDILSLDYASLAQELGQRLILFGNLPYYLSSRLLYRLLEERKHLSLAVFMFQKEVAERLLAPPGNRNYGPLTVYLSLTAEVKRLLTLSKNHFYPPPEVSSCVLKIIFNDIYFDCETFLKKLLKVSFAKRRKKLITNLKALGVRREVLEEIFQELGLGLNVRAEQVPPSKFLALAKRLFENTSSKREGGF